jgi:hypothetical protein
MVEGVSILQIASASVDEGVAGQHATYPDRAQKRIAARFLRAFTCK